MVATTLSRACAPRSPISFSDTPPVTLGHCCRLQSRSCRLQSSPLAYAATYSRQSFWVFSVLHPFDVSLNTNDNYYLIHVIPCNCDHLQSRIFFRHAPMNTAYIRNTSIGANPIICRTIIWNWSFENRPFVNTSLRLIAEGMSMKSTIFSSYCSLW